MAIRAGLFCRQHVAQPWHPASVERTQPALLNCFFFHHIAKKKEEEDDDMKELENWAGTI